MSTAFDPMEELRDAARAALPPLEGELRVPGLREPVEVLRDRWGIAYVSANSLEDLWFAQGFVQASERLFQIELAIRAATGRLSEWFGELSVPVDRFARTVGFHRIGEAEAERWTPRSRAMMGRFIAGARAWVASMPSPALEHALLAVPAELPEELGPWASTFGYVAWGLSGNWDHELVRALLIDRFGGETAEVLLPPAPPGPPELAAGSLAGRLLDGMPRSRGQGSNNWAVAGRRTASGKPLLANDPHLLVQQPAAWFEIHLRAPGYEARGAAFPFAPGVAIGMTEHHAWGFTNVSGDVQDLYLERLNEDHTAAEFDGAWEPLEVRTEAIVVRGGRPITFDVAHTRHGPILDAAPVGVIGSRFEPIEQTYALAWTGADGLLEPASLIDLGRARSFEEARGALRSLHCPGQNVVYADVDGTIGFQCTGRYPIRRRGDGTVPVPGWTSEYGWDSSVPFDDLPWSKDPGSGFLATANNRTWDEDYPFLIGLDVHAPFRARRIADVLGEGEGLRIEDMARLQVDTRSLPALRLVPLLLEATPSTERRERMLERLRLWDGDLLPESVAAAVYEVWVGRLAARALGAAPDVLTSYFAWREPFVCVALPAMLEERIPPPAGGTWDDIVPVALDDAMDELEQRLGADPEAWRWGALHRVRFAHPLARFPGAGALFVAAEHELGGDEQTVLQSAIDAHLGYEAVVVPSWRFVADLGDPDRSAAVLTTGQSGNPVSPHWNDQAALWGSGELRPCPVTRAAIEAAAERSLVLLPG
ncbi:MAG: penicillin acylase family protein [Actinobacteria bacterium]|nr:penicillin acylase family protein [Actinomycetota bacterium]